jgi:peptidylprolyl isomerase
MTRLTLLLAVLLAACGSSEEPAFEPMEREVWNNRNAAAEEESPAEEPVAAPTPAPAPAADGQPPMSIEAPPDVAAAPADAAVTPSGLASRQLRAGTGTTHPTATDRVTVHYTGWTTDGQRFDSSVERGQPATFPLSGVIRGWTEGVQLMVEGERRRFWIPANLAYGENPRPGAPQGMLVFDIELIRIGA